jgi:rod shape-determining protein MreD
MSLAAGALLVVIAAIAQVSITPQFSIFGAQPNLVLVVLVAWMAVRPKRETLLLIPLGGILLGLYDDQPLGVAILALLPLILMVEVLEMRLVQSTLLQAVVIIIIATLFYEVAFLLTLTVAGEPVDWLAVGLDVLVPAVIANTLVLFPVYGIVRLATVESRSPAY